MSLRTLVYISKKVVSFHSPSQPDHTAAPVFSHRLDVCYTLKSHNKPRNTRASTACPGCLWTGLFLSICWFRSWCWPASGPVCISWSPAFRTLTSGATSP